jgi:phospholipid/cholesterol/gamma-HCH transport system substrate-binding protein
MSLMERDARYALVGLLSVVLMVGLAAFVIWLAGKQFSQSFDQYVVDFKGPVRGLSSGGEVFFNGIKVGEVTRLSLNAKDPNRVLARIRITSDAPVRVDSVATLEPLGVTGVNYILISGGTPSKPLLKDVTPAGETPLIHAAQGQLESLFEGGGTVMARAVEALDRFNRVLSDDNIRQFSGTLHDIHEMTTELKNHKQLIADLDETITSAKTASDRIAALAESSNQLVNGDLKRSLRNLGDAAVEIKGAAQETRELIVKLKSPSSEFAENGLPQLNRTVASLQQAADTLNRMVADIEANPASFLAKPPSKTIEVKP